jgi:hypothetical protein
MTRVVHFRAPSQIRRRALNLLHGYASVARTSRAFFVGARTMVDHEMRADEADGDWRNSELESLRFAFTRADSKVIARMIETRASILADRTRAQRPSQDAVELAVEAMVLATAEMSLAALRMLLDGDPVAFRLLGNDAYERVATALRTDLERSPLSVQAY